MEYKSWADWQPIVETATATAADKSYTRFILVYLSRGLLPATEFGLGIIREDDVCGGYGLGPSGEWLGGCGAPADVLASCCWCCCWSVLDGVSAGDAVALLESSSTTGEHASARTLWARPWRPLPLRLPSLLHSRLEPLRSSFSEELVMVAKKRWKEKELWALSVGDMRKRVEMYQLYSLCDINIHLSQSLVWYWALMEPWITPCFSSYPYLHCSETAFFFLLTVTVGLHWWKLGGNNFIDLQN